jgi:hypothetical protein
MQQQKNFLSLAISPRFQQKYHINLKTKKKRECEKHLMKEENNCNLKKRKFDVQYIFKFCLLNK